MSRREKLKKLRENIENTSVEVADIKKATRKLVSKSEISVDEYKDIISIYDDWQAGVAYSKGQVVKYKDELWEVIQDHSSQVDWTPDSVPALFKSVTAPKTNDGVEIVPDFKQPKGGHDAYKKGDKVKFEGKVYESLIDNNSYSPSAYPQGWEVIN
nr:MAG TPA: ChiA1-BD-binding domain protein [Caudoviricetes sp.]